MTHLLELAFSRLKPEGYRVTSPPTTQYNCIAWAAGRDDRWWWPDADSYWPEGAQKEETIESFAAAFAMLGYKTCEASEFEAGCEKIAIFVDSMGTPTHAARQLPSGKWTSKCGRLEDIEHDLLEAVGGNGAFEYGAVALIMKCAL